MACSEIGQLRQQVVHQLDGTLSHWQRSLQAKWGDPAVYEAQETERLKQDARMVYDMNRRTTALLSDAYTKQEEKQRDDHTKRMTDLKRRGYRSGGTRPESEAAQTRKRQPPAQPSPAPA